MKYIKYVKYKFGKDVLYMKILLVDDEAKIREVLKDYAEFYNHVVDEAVDGIEAIKKCQEQDYDAVVMDVMMPKLDGISAVKEIKKMKDVPILMLSARGEEYDKLYGFEVGVDDYVVKPFSPKEIFARIAAITKRNTRPITKIEGLEIDFEGRNVFVDGQKLTLTQKEYQLLEFLVRHRGIAVSREKLLTEVWDYNFLGDDRTIDTHIKMLRNNLGPYKHFIVTLRGYGYKFDEKAAQ